MARENTSFTVMTGLHLALVSGSHFANPQTGSKPPNIIFILADDLGCRDLRCWGEMQIATLNIDRLAAEGMCFSQHRLCADARVADDRQPHGSWPHSCQPQT